MTYNDLLNRWIGVAGFIERAKKCFGTGRNRDGQKALSDALKTCNEEIDRLREHLESHREYGLMDIWNE